MRFLILISVTIMSFAAVAKANTTCGYVSSVETTVYPTRKKMGLESTTITTKVNAELNGEDVVIFEYTPNLGDRPEHEPSILNMLLAAYSSKSKVCVTPNDQCTIENRRDCGFKIKISNK